MLIRQRPVPNFEKGRGQYRPEMIVIHVAEGNRESVYQEFMGVEKSSHYLICVDGNADQYVSESDTAWGNGIVNRPTAKIILERNGQPVNKFTISIEHEGYGNKDINEAQYKASSDLIREICKRWLIPIDGDHIIRHRTINAGKLCPGLINVERLIKMASINPEEIADTILKTKENLDKNFSKQDADGTFKRFISFLLASLGL